MTSKMASKMADNVAAPSPTYQKQTLTQHEEKFVLCFGWPNPSIKIVEQRTTHNNKDKTLDHEPLIFKMPYTSVGLTEV